MKDCQFQLLASLSEAFGPSGCEERVLDLIENEIKDFSEVSRDPSGNLIAHIQGEGEKIMVTCNVDEAGLMVTDIDDKGFVRVEPTGFMDGSCFIGKLFTVGNEKETVNNAIGGGKVLHLLQGNEHSDVPSISRLFLDCGFESKEEAEKHFEKGDYAAYEGAPLEKFPGNHFVGKALDSRAPVYVAVDAIKNIKNPSADLYFVFAVKEKAGFSSAPYAAFNIHPDKAVLLDFTLSNDFEKVAEEEKGAPLGSGVALSLMDQKALYYDSPFFYEVLKKADELHIPYTKTTVTPMGGNSSGNLHTALSGIPSVSLRIPCRNPETPNSIMKESDIEATSSLLLGLIG